MAFTKITSSDLNSRGATTLPNQPKISATALKQEFDAPAKEVVAPKFNNLIDELEGESAAASLGATAPTGRTGNTVQAVMNKLSVDLKTVEDGMSEAIAEAHSHPNKELLDSYTQTETDLADAVANTHAHSNKALLDSYDQDNTDLTEAVASMHTHDNKSVLDKFDEEGGEPTYDGNPIGGGQGDMLASDYDPDDTVKNAGGIEDYVASQAYELPTASAAVKGGIKVGTNLSINDGVLSATDTTYSDATTSASGLMSASDKTKLDGVENNANNYSLPTASTSTLGGVKVDGSSVTIDGNGVISAPGGGGGGTTVIANPTGAATDDLEKLQVGTTIYEIPDTTYESKQAAQGGTDVSLVTTGEKYTWNEKISKSATAGLVKNDGTIDQTTYVSDVSGKADKVSSATNGNFAGLDSNGNLTDSGSKASDFLPSNTPIPDAVTANPQGTATGTLTKLGIGSDIYNIQGGGSSTLVGLSDVDITSPSDGQILQYDATSQKWVNHVNAPEYISVTVDIYSASSDTVTYTDATGQKTVTTDTDGHGQATIICANGDSITFTSSVAKNPNNLSQAYSKSVTIGANTTEVYVMPEGAVYWYGYFKTAMQAYASKPSIASGDVVTPTVTVNTNSVIVTKDSNGYCTGSYLTTQAIDVSSYSKVVIFATSARTAGGGGYGGNIVNTVASANSSNYDAVAVHTLLAAPDAGGTQGTGTNIKDENDISSVLGSKYIGIRHANVTGSITIAAIWLE